MRRLAEALCAADARPLLEQSSFTPDLLALDTQTPEEEDLSAAVASLIFLREVMIDVSTGGCRIQDRNDDYIVKHSELKAVLPDVGIEYTIAYDDLWAWYEEWKANLPSYMDRRQHVRKLLNPIIDATLKKTQSTVKLHREPTGWERVDRAVSAAKRQLDGARNEEDFQAVGLLCREILISVAQAVYMPDEHRTLDGVVPSQTDAKRMMEAFLHSSFPGDSFKEVRSHARASIDLSLNLQHRRTATRQLAALCFEATSSTCAVMRILSKP